jgi:hypothetical protein
METSARHYKGISGYCMAAVPKMSFNFVPLVHPNGRGCGKSVQKGGHHGHILAGPGEGRALHLPPPPPLAVDHHGTLCLKRKFAIVKFSQLGLNRYSLAGKFALSLRGPALSVDL